MASGFASFQLDRNKFKEVVILISQISEPSRLGAVKLHKVFYFSDMLAFAFWGRSITGSVYRKRDFGPTSDYLPIALRELQHDGSILISHVDYFGFRQAMYLPQRAPDTSRLTNEEQALITDVIDFVVNQNTAKTISQLSHNRAWEIAEFGAEIPYHSAFALFPTEISTDTLDWAVSIAGEIEAESTQRSALEYKSFRSLRASV